MAAMSGVLVYLNCQHCNQGYLVRLKESDQKYCSTKCYGAARVGRKQEWFVTPKSTHAQRRMAHKTVYNMLYNGTVTKPDRCSQCQTVGKVEAHHDSYETPDVFVWLCRSCHQRRHVKKKLAS